MARAHTGAGGYGRAVAEAAIAAGEFTLVGLVDDRWPDQQPVWDMPVASRMGGGSAPGAGAWSRAGKALLPGQCLTSARALAPSTI